jgi:hypothetical protein
LADDRNVGALVRRQQRRHSNWKSASTSPSDNEIQLDWSGELPASARSSLLSGSAETVTVPAGQPEPLTATMSNGDLPGRYGVDGG